jgi:hypothetical protein
MKKVIRLTESDLATIVRRVINENKIQNNTRYYSNRNLRRLGKTPIVMVESIEDYRPLLNEGILDTIKDKLMSLLDGAKDFFKEKGQKMKDSVEDYFGKDLEDITLDDVKTAIKDEFSSDTELTEEKPKKIRDMFDKADVGGDAGQVKWDRPFHKVMDIIQHIFAVNLLSMGLLGSFLQSVFTSIPTSWTLHLLISGLAIVVITFIRKLVAVLGGKFKK